MKRLLFAVLLLVLPLMCSAYEYRDFQGRTLQQIFRDNMDETDREVRQRKQERYQEQMLQQQIEQNRRLDEINDNLQQIENEQREENMRRYNYGIVNDYQ